MLLRKKYLTTLTSGQLGSAPKKIGSIFLFVIFQNFVNDSESALLRENNNLTEEQCNNLMKTLRLVWLDPVIKDLQDAANTEFLVLEERLRSVYHKLDSDFRQQATGSKSLCSNLAYVFELVWKVYLRNSRIIID